MDWYDKFTSLPMRTINIIILSYFIGVSLLAITISYYTFK